MVGACLTIRVPSRLDRDAFVSRIVRVGIQMNKTGSGDVTLWEFREYFDLPDDRSTTRLFRCFDEDRDNRIGFAEFVVGLWTYCKHLSCTSSQVVSLVTLARALSVAGA